MISNNLDYISNTFKIIILILKGFYNYKKFLIINIIIIFNPNKFPELKYYRVLILLNIITGLVLL